MATKKKPSLRALIHPSYTWLMTKFHDTSEPGLVIVSVKTLQDMVNEVEKTAATIYPDDLPDSLHYSLKDVNYVLRRLTEMDAQGQIVGNEDVRVFGDSFQRRFAELLEHLENIDAER